MKRALFCALVLFSVSLFAASPNAVLIQSAVLDSGHVFISGQNFGNGIPVVKLAGAQLNVTSFSPTAIVADAPQAIAPGTYLLTVVTGNGTNQVSEFDLTVGAVGPQGPQGPQGPPGVALPFTGSVAVSTPAFSVANTGAGHAISATASGGAGVFATSDSGYGVYSQSDSGVAVAGLSSHGNGVTAVSGGANGYGLAAQNSGGGSAALFIGDVSIQGSVSKSSGSFKIDHPLDPENKYLYHSFVESPDMMNIYNGNIVLDANGEAVVDLPDWFEALNRDFRYQLTCIGGFAPVYVSEEISANQFKIAGGKPGMKVSWQVTGVRHDRYAEAHRIPVEQEKSLAERGFYLHPELFGQPEERSIEWAVHPELMRALKAQATRERR